MTALREALDKDRPPRTPRDQVYEESLKEAFEALNDALCTKNQQLDQLLQERQQNPPGLVSGASAPEIGAVQCPVKRACSLCSCPWSYHGRLKVK